MLVAIYLIYYGVKGIKNKVIIYKGRGQWSKEFRGREAVLFGLFWLIAGLAISYALVYYKFINNF